MGFETFLGNEQLKENLFAAVNNDRISHFYLLSGPEGSGKRTLARLLAAAALCRGENKPCGRCDACRKVMADSHPDFITVTDPEHKNVAVKIVRQIREDVFVLPNESDKKVYLFPQELGTEGQNALLKILEEPPVYGVFLLLAKNPESLLPTVRSRCVELKLRGLPESLLRQLLQKKFPDAQEESITAAINRSGGFLGQAEKLLSEGQDMLSQTMSFAKSFAAKDTLGLMQTLLSMEKWKRDPLIDALEQWTGLLTQSLSCKAGLPAANTQARVISESRSATEIEKAATAVQQGIVYAHSNVSTAAICGWLSWELR